MNALLDERVLVFAPTGGDGALTVEILDSYAIPAVECGDVAALAGEARRGVGALIVAEDAVDPARGKRLVNFIAGQPAWSDVPVILFAVPRSDALSPVDVIETYAWLGNVTLLERPIRAIPLVSAVQTGLRARRRQYEVRDHLAERRRIEREHARLLAAEQVARAAVEAANRAKDEFLAVLSHELRTPLQSMLGWLRLLRSGTLDAPGTVRALDTIERNTRAQAQLIEDLLDVSRIIAGKLRIELKPVRLRAAVEAAVDAVRGAADAKRIAIATDFGGGDVELDADAVRLQQIVWNLVSNAVKFTPEGGRVTVAVTREDGLAVIRVADSGPGIPADVLPHIFQRFRQADASNTRAHGGLGLGLAIVRHLVEMHGGSVSAENHPQGQGALFTVRLHPSEAALAEAPSARGAARPAQLPLPGEPLLDGLSLLVVDDDAGAREVIVTVLQNEGARVVTAGSVADALAMLQRERPDAVISDISMPGEDGYMLARRLRRLERGRRRTRALALTAHARPEDTEQAILAGFDAHVAKPIDPADLALRIARLVGRTGPSTLRARGDAPEALGA